MSLKSPPTRFIPRCNLTEKVLRAPCQVSTTPIPPQNTQKRHLYDTAFLELLERFLQFDTQPREGFESSLTDLYDTQHSARFKGNNGSTKVRLKIPKTAQKCVTHRLFPSGSIATKSASRRPRRCPPQWYRCQCRCVNANESESMSRCRPQCYRCRNATSSSSRCRNATLSPSRCRPRRTSSRRRDDEGSGIGRSKRRTRSTSGEVSTFGRNRETRVHLGRTLVRM